MAINKRLLVKPPSSGVTPSENFKAVTYTGNSSDQSITGLGFKPDFVWIKERPENENHNLIDSTRGTNKILSSNLSNAEFTSTRFTSFDTDGFTLANNNETNDNGVTYVAWCWKAGEGTTSSNTDGSITSTVQTNTDAGFSIVKWTGNGSASATVGHNLGAVPDVIILKDYSNTRNWMVHVSSAPAANQPFGGNLDISNAFNTSAGTNGGHGTPTSSVLTFTNGSSSVNNVNANNANIVAYCFKSIEGYSKFGSYTGNGSDNGPIVETGFEPAFLMFKRTDSASAWVMIDNARDPSNPRLKYLMAQGVNSEASDLNGVDFLANGFQIKDDYADWNTSGSPYIYMAFAADPDTEAPTLADSFNIETYTGDSSAEVTVNGFGFAPSFVWLKSITPANEHNLYDTIRGATFKLRSDATAAQANTGALGEFTNDGFTLRSGGYSLNQDNNDYIAWAWKADDNEATIEEVTEDADSIAIYKFEDNADDVTGNYDGTAYNVTYASGKFNKAGVFNGTSAYIDLGSNMGLSDNSFSFSFWYANTETTSGGDVNTYVIGDLDTTDQTNKRLHIGRRSFNEKLTFAFNGNDMYSATNVSTDGTWQFWTCTFNASNQARKIYLNGVLDQSQTASANYTGTANITIGKAAHSNSYAKGMVDQVRVFNKELNAASVTNLYNETAAQNSTVNIGTKQTNSAQSIVSANANAGFSIVKYNNATGPVPHGLSTTPRMIIQKKLNDTQDWYVYFPPGVIDSNYNYMVLNSDAAKGTTSSTAPTATTFNAASDSGEYIAYCFHSVSGYSKLGSYSGSSSAVTVTTGFKPDYILIKRTNNSSRWIVLDAKRNFFESYLDPSDSLAEQTDSEIQLSVTSTTFVLPAGSNSAINTSGSEYIYWAIAKNATNNNTLANSFKAVTYTGNSGTQAITGVGFKPDLVWTKARNEANYSHFLTDSIRGGTKVIQSNSSAAEITRADNIQSFNSDGFTLAGDGTSNYNSTTYAAWCWKAGNTWQSNIDGTIGSTVNVNTANGFSIVKWNGDGSASATVGHNLSSKPDMVIVKDLSEAGGWNTCHVGLASNEGIGLESTGAAFTSMGNNGGITYANLSATTFGFATGAVGVNSVNKSGNEYIAYCWHSVSGYSKFGSYTGGGNTNPTINVGFAPDWLMVKKATGTATGSTGWTMVDSARHPGTPTYDNGNVLYADDNLAEQDDDNERGFIITSTGFSPNGNYFSTNNSGDTYIYMAFKMN